MHNTLYISLYDINLHQDQASLLSLPQPHDLDHPDSPASVLLGTKEQSSASDNLSIILEKNPPPLGSPHRYFKERPLSNSPHAEP